MKTKHGITLGIAAALLLASAPGRGQTLSAARKQNIAENRQLNATTLSLYNRQGKLVDTVGPRDMFGAAVFSPDAKRMAIVRIDLENESRDIWVLDLATHQWTRITTSPRRERAFLPAWSPDGSYVAYGALRAGNFGLYRKPANGQGSEELLYQAPGSPALSDWSMDGRFLSFVTNELKAGGALYVLPLDGAERKPVEVYRSKRALSGGFFSPDSHYLSFASNDSGRNEVYVVPRDRSAAPVQISEHGAAGAGPWRRDGKEFYFLLPDQSAMSVAVNSSSGFKASKPKLLFRQPAATHAGFNISRDGERIVMAEIQSQLRQITAFDREGKTVKKVGEPAFYFDPMLSPDGTRLAMVRRDPVTGNMDIWTLELATGKTHAVTNDTWPNFDPNWSPDGSQVAYESARDEDTSVYRKAWDGTGQEEFLFRHTPGANMGFSDWSPDGQFLTGSVGAILMIPLRPEEKPIDRKAIDWMRDEFDAWLPRFSPDMRHVAYLSNPTDVDVFEVYIRGFDANHPDAPGSGAPVHVPSSGAQALLNWRRDGKELFFVTRAWEVAAIEITPGPELEASAPKVLFKLPRVLPGDMDSWKNVNATGDRFVFAIPVEGASAPN